MSKEAESVSQASFYYPPNLRFHPPLNLIWGEVDFLKRPNPGSNLAYDAWKWDFFLKKINFFSQPIIFPDRPRHEKVIRPKFPTKIVARSRVMNF